MPQAPYGSWPSAIQPEDLTAATVGLGVGRICAGSRYWTQSHPEQGGRVTLWQEDPGGSRRDLTPGQYLRSGVNEYGGGEWDVAPGLVVFSSWPDGSIMVIEGEHPPRQLAPGGDFRYACLSIVPQLQFVLAVREDHSRDGSEPETTVVALDLPSGNNDGGRVLLRGADFYAHPCLSPDGRLAWCEWDHPAMPWDSSRIGVAPLSDPGAVHYVGGGPGVSALYPAWSPGGALLFLSDTTGFWNFQRWDAGEAAPLHVAPYDFCGPLWTLDPVPYCIIDDNRVGCTWLEEGIARLGVQQRDAAGTVGLKVIDTAAVAASLGGAGDRCLALLGYVEHPARLVELDWGSGRQRPIQAAAATVLESRQVSRAKAATWDSPYGPVHGWFYPPAHPDFTAPPGERPPVQVWSHGGPTAFASPEFRIGLQFWTSRGIGILDVNYGGSSGYGREYRQRLNGRWGIVDVADCVAGAQHLVAQGLADPARLSIRGSSAGGFTTLAALTSSDVFAAGISLYGIGDLETLATDTHKFERHYLETLVAPYPEGRATYVERSPVHRLDRLSCPMLILQGTDDKVVPPSQAEAMAAAVHAKGLPATLIMFSDEGHGFRRAQTITATAEACLAFLGSVHGFDRR